MRHRHVRWLLLGGAFLSVFMLGFCSHHLHSLVYLVQLENKLAGIEDGQYIFSEEQGEVKAIVAIPSERLGESDGNNSSLAKSFLTKGEWERIHLKGFTDKEWHVPGAPPHRVYVYKPIPNGGKKMALRE